ncbi:hypothetical protein HAX54_049547 [Datura stramonium]|uniref:DOG1 domain-containing protein n=1 Tax=Datura stramonium TaxID=4076 RepID=A0ABS8WQA6_DATST|nr:hypothetical protein [Datura stramonium]
MASTSRPRTSEECLYETWTSLQREEVKELEQAVARTRKGEADEHQLTQLIKKMVQHYQDYANNRCRLARTNVSPLFAPTSCTPLENSVLWIGGCRPSSFIRFAYALCGMDIESRLADFLQGRKVGNLGELTTEQVAMIDALQAKTIKEENKLTSRLASLQEDIVDQPLVSKANKELGDSTHNHHECGNADEALDEHAQHMADVMEAADELRMKTLKEIVFTILLPVQAVEYLAAAKRMRLCFQQWGKKREIINVPTN